MTAESVHPSVTADWGWGIGKSENWCAGMMTRRHFLQRMGAGLAAQGLLNAFAAFAPATAHALLPPPDEVLLNAGTNATAAPETLSKVFELAVRGQNLLAEGRYAEALTVLRNAASLEAQSDFVQGLLGRTLLALGDRKGATAHFRHAANLNPEDTYSRMMADMLSQHPEHRLDRRSTSDDAGQPGMPDAGVDTSGMARDTDRNTDGRKLTPLENAARQEEADMARLLADTPDTQAGYRVRRVVLDAGHGGFDSGAVGAEGLMEKDVNLELALACASVLRQRAPALRVFLTRTGDYYVPLSARTAVANQHSADLFISFHCNASENRAAQGVETYFCSEQASSKEAQRVARFENAVLRYEKAAATQQDADAVNIENLLFRYERRRYWQAADAAAGIMQKLLAKRLPFPDRGVHSADFYVLRKARMPSILLETGFISNDSEERLLSDAAYRQRMAASVASGIMNLAGTGGQA